jgi:2-pyrone-4,6-dicarboxylate lactonase
MPAAASPPKPHFVAPAGACDAHCHVFGPEQRFPYAPGQGYYPPPSPREALLALHAAMGLSRGVIVQGAEYAFDNGIVLDAIAAAPERYRGIAVLDPQASDAELERLHRGGVRGVRLSLLHGASGDPATWQRLATRIRPLGWHLELHLQPADIIRFSDAIAALPLPVVIDHIARIPAAGGISQPAFQALLELVRRDNGWVKISGLERITAPPYAAVVPLAKALLAAAPQRIVWGSDFPHPKLDYRPDDAALLDLIPLFAPDAADRQRLLVDNPARLYDF